jgi:hypothetical protein
MARRRFGKVYVELHLLLDSFLTGDWVMAIKSFFGWILGFLTALLPPSSGIYFPSAMNQGLQ